LRCLQIGTSAVHMKSVVVFTTYHSSRSHNGLSDTVFKKILSVFVDKAGFSRYFPTLEKEKEIQNLLKAHKYFHPIWMCSENEFRKAQVGFCIEY
jgi:hypothetical protein